MARHRVLSGIRATGRLHLGNYLGAVKGMLELQDDPDYETFYMVADAHAVTTPFDIDALRKNRREVIIDYLACGLDPEKSVIFQQAEVGAHFELSFYLSSAMTIARMQHLPTFKEKVKQYPDNANMALLNYPVLMAADILAYKADSVPVGLDQLPHLEVSREIARKMNAMYQMDFAEPVRFETQGAKVPSLTGDGKMSKSIEGSYINLNDSLEEIESKVKRIPTDSGTGRIETVTREQGGKEISEPSYVADQAPSAGIKALMELVELFQGSDKRKEYESAYTSSGIRYGDAKKELAVAIYKDLEPIQEKRRELEGNPGYIEQVIISGAQKAREVAEATVLELRSKMGLG